MIKPDTFSLPRCTSAELLFSCCSSVAALALANCNEHVAEVNITSPAHTQRALHGAQGSRGKRGKITSFPVRDTRARATGFSCFCAKLTLGVSYVSPPLPALSLPRAPRLQAAYSREIVHMHDIGGDGKHFCDNDAQLGRINVFYHGASC
jgi:hypothetical protein